MLCSTYGTILTSKLVHLTFSSLLLFSQVFIYQQFLCGNFTCICCFEVLQERLNAAKVISKFQLTLVAKSEPHKSNTSGSVATADKSTITIAIGVPVFPTG